MAARARAFGVALRPHAKTHKCVELGRRQLAHGACGLTVATPVEAEVFARAGVTDLTWAFPIAPAHIARVRRIAQETDATLRVVVDDLETARARARRCTCGSRWTAAITAPAWTRPRPTRGRWPANSGASGGWCSTASSVTRGTPTRRAARPKRPGWQKRSAP